MAEERDAIMGRPVAYSEGGAQLRGELYEPAAPNGYGVLVVHEADGIGGNVRRRCALLADLGYVAFAADLHGARRPLEGDEMQRAVASFLAEPDRLRRRTAAGLDALLTEAMLEPGKTAAIGYCFGGTAVLELARSGAAVAAVSSFHGLLTTRMPAPPQSIRAKIAAFTGAKDPLVPPADVAGFQTEMASADADWQLSIYGQAWHSFTNVGVVGSADARMRYDPVADHLSWSASMAFIEQALGVQSPG